jgi:hypothetical protein
MHKWVEIVVALALLGLAVAPVAAQEAPPPPPFLLPPTANQSLDPSVWKGLYVGSEVFGVSAKGGKGGFGGGSYLGYDRAFADGVALGVQGNLGYAPSLFRQGSASGFDYASGGFKLGYQMDRLTTWVSIGATFAKPDVVGRGYTTANESVNDLVNGRSGLKASGEFAAGADYAVTENLKVTVSVEGRAGRGAWGFASPER